MSVSLHVFVCCYCTSKHVLCNLALTVGCILVCVCGRTVTQTCVYAAMIHDRVSTDQISNAHCC
jgi:hypothetical protein